LEKRGSNRRRIHTPTFTFYSPARFVLDVLFWYGIALAIIFVIIYTAQGIYPVKKHEQEKRGF
jgi:hypothetical protein